MEANYPAARVTRLVGLEKNTVYTKSSYLASTNHMSVLKWATITHQMKTLCNKIKIQNPQIIMDDNKTALIKFKVLLTDRVLLTYHWLNQQKIMLNNYILYLSTQTETFCKAFFVKNTSISCGFLFKTTTNWVGANNKKFICIS